MQPARTAGHCSVQNSLMATGSLALKFRWQSTGAHSADQRAIQGVVKKQKHWRGLKRRHTIVAAGALVVGALWIIHGVGDLVIAASAGPVPGRGLRPPRRRDS